MTHTIEKYGDVGNFSGVSYVMLPFMNLKFVGTWAPTAKIIGDIPDFNVINVPKTQPGHNPVQHEWMGPNGLTDSTDNTVQPFTSNHLQGPHRESPNGDSRWAVVGAWQMILSSTHPGTAVGAYFYSVTAEKWLIASLPNFETIRRTHLSISCKIFSGIRMTKLKIHAMEFCDFMKDSVSPCGLFVPCSLTVTSTWWPRLTAHCPIGEHH